MANHTEILKGLAEILDPALVKRDPDITAKYGVDHAIPWGVVFPRTTEEVSAVVKFAARENLAIVPWGSGSKMGKGNPPGRLDLVVCTARLNHMIDVDAANLTMTIEAGVKFRDIQARLATEEDRCYLPLGELGTEEDEIICSDRSHSGCFLPLDPPWSERATIGGILACNTSGPRRLLYGLPRDLVLGVRFVSPDGQIVGAGGKTVKNVSGYDISKLMIGSMGSIGILCEMTLRLLPLPECMETCLFSFGSLSGAVAFANRVFGTKLLPAAVEVMNDGVFKNIPLDSTQTLVSGDYAVAVALEAFEEAVARMRADLMGMAEDSGAKSNARIMEQEHLRFWLAISNMGPPLSGPVSNLIAAQLNVPISKWDTVMALSVEVLSAQSIRHTLLAHAGSGTCLVDLLLDRHDTPTMTNAVRAIDELFRTCRESGGNLVIQRAPTDLKKELPIWGEPGPDLPLMKRLKERLDPAGTMSPGKFIGGL